jgi:thiol-disulfide isomerase/thioredoxin
MKRNISYKNVIIAFLLTIIVFALGVSIGNYSVGRKYNELSSFISDLRLQTMSMELQFSLLSEDPCNAMNSNYLERELSILNNRLDYLEQLYGNKDPEIIQMKKYYSLLQIRHWLLFSKAQDTCDSNLGLILYFYSNDYCPDCNAQGNVLTSFRNKYSDEIKVYAFDVDLDDFAVSTLVEMYDISQVPTIIYNDDYLPGLTNMQKLEEVRLNYNLTLDKDIE